MAATKVTLVIPDREKFPPAPIPFGVVSGEGVPDYDNQKSGGKRGGMEYSVSIILGKKERKDVLKTVMNYWEENKPKGGDDKPANYKNIVRTNDDGDYILYSKTQVDFEGKANIVTIRNHEGVKLDPEEFGAIGKGSEGRLAVKMGVYGNDEDAGVSLYLAAVQLTEFVAYEGGDASDAFGDEKGHVDGGEFKPEKKKDKKKKKKKEKK